MPQNIKCISRGVFLHASHMQTWVSNSLRQSRTVPHRMKDSVQTVSSDVGWDRKHRLQVEGNPPVTGPPNLGTSPRI